MAKYEQNFAESRKSLLFFGTKCHYLLGESSYDRSSSSEEDRETRFFVGGALKIYSAFFRLSLPFTTSAIFSVICEKYFFKSPFLKSAFILLVVDILIVFRVLSHLLVKSWQHEDGKGDQIEQEEVVHFVSDPSDGEEGQDGPDEVEDGLLLLGLSAEPEGVVDAADGAHDLVADLLELLLFHTGPCIGFEDLSMSHSW